MANRQEVLVETKAVLRALEDDDEGLWAIVASMLPGERWLLREAVRKVMRTIDAMDGPP